MKRAKVCVVKVGGSLLTGAAVGQRLRTWLSAKRAVEPSTHFILVVGGGKWVDAIRAVDAHAPLGEERTHWICVELLDVTAGLIHAMLPELAAVVEFEALERRILEPGVTLLKPQDFLARIEPTRRGSRLPSNWSVTSDSIAGRLAIVLAADELVLLKSAMPPSTGSGENWLMGLSAVNYVDAFFPAMQCELPPTKFELLPSLLTDS